MKTKEIVNLDFDARVPIPFSVFPSSYRVEPETQSEGHTNAAEPSAEEQVPSPQQEQPVQEVAQPEVQQEQPVQEVAQPEVQQAPQEEYSDTQSEGSVKSEEHSSQESFSDVESVRHSHPSKTFIEGPRRRTYRNYHETQVDVAEQDIRIGSPIVEPPKPKLHSQPIKEDRTTTQLIVAAPQVTKSHFKKTTSKNHHPVKSCPADKMGFYDDDHSRSEGGRSSAEPAYTHNTVTIPCHHIRVGDLLILQGRPCQVIRITTSAATGQHRYLGVDLFTKQLHEESSFISNPSPSVVVQTMLGPVFKQYRVLDLQDGTVVAMTETGDVKQAVPVIDQSGLWSRLSDAFKAGRGSVRVLVISDAGRELAVDMKVIHGSRI
ncbi:hypothetical protein K3495_g1574 [Podosphaera aphanis]|nr:hypothetical protein K3495_g1574 [Podosphaera aphanis]